MRLLLFLVFLGSGVIAKADSGVLGLGEAMLLVGILVFIAYVGIVFFVSLFVRWILNSLTNGNRRKVWIIYLGVILFSLPILLSSEIGDLSFGSGYIILVVASGLVGGVIGYFISRKEKRTDHEQ